MARKCKDCGTTLCAYNRGLLCWPCQEKKKGQLQEQISDTPHYTVSNLCFILGFAHPESVKRLARKGTIPGRIPGIKQHLFLREEVNRWIHGEQETPHKHEESLMVHGLSSGDTGVEFSVINISNSLIIVDRICVEIVHWEKYYGRLTTGALIIPRKYKVKLRPNFVGEIKVPTPKFRMPKDEVESFAISFISPPGNKYTVRIKLYCSDPNAGSKFTLSTDTFEIRFHKHRIVRGEGTSSSHAIAEAQKLIAEVPVPAKQAEAHKIAGSGETLSTHDHAIALARKIVDEAKRKK